MLIVPLLGDKITTKDGITFTVLSYTNYKSGGPAVYVEHTPLVPSDAVYFFDIVRINNIHVDFISSGKIFKTTSNIKRKINLPQPSDIVIVKQNNQLSRLKVDSLKLHRRGELAKGLLVIGEDPDSKEKIPIRLTSIIDIDRNIGNDLFSRDKFLKCYKDYTGN